MKLEKIKIVNFRSIKDLDIDFYNNSRVLVGINEAGKSNILKAAALLSDDVGCCEVVGWVDGTIV